MSSAEPCFQAAICAVLAEIERRRGVGEQKRALGGGDFRGHGEGGGRALQHDAAQAELQGFQCAAGGVRAVQQGRAFEFRLFQQFLPPQAAGIERGAGGGEQRDRQAGLQSAPRVRQAVDNNGGGKFQHFFFFSLFLLVTGRVR